MKILGLSAYHQEAAAALVVNGQALSAIQESQFTKKPLDPSLPLRAARSCLDRAGLHGPDLDRIVFYEKPLRRFERTLTTSLRPFPRGGRRFTREVRNWLGDRLWLKGRLCEEFGVGNEKIRFVDHLSSHAACAFYLSPFERAAVLVADDVGEWATTALYRATPAGLELLLEVQLPHSFGLAALGFAQFLGLGSTQGVAHMHDLASYGEPSYYSEVSAILGATEDASPLIDETCLNLEKGGDDTWTPEMEQRFGPARIPGSPLRMHEGDRRDADLAASVQQVLQERLVASAAFACQEAGESDLCFAGILAKNRGINRALLECPAVDRLYVPAEPSDAGGALGAALLQHHCENPEVHGAPSARAHNSLFLGEDVDLLSDQEPHKVGQCIQDLIPSLQGGKALAWVRGALEFSFESLHHRIVLADPSGANARANLLASMQHTDPYLTCRIALPAERIKEYAEPISGAETLALMSQLQWIATPDLKRLAPSAVAPDGSVRIQSVDPQDDPELHSLLLAYGAKQGAPVLLCETFCLRDSVPPRSDLEALDAFGRSSLGALLVNDRLYEEQIR